MRWHLFSLIFIFTINFCFAQSGLKVEISLKDGSVVKGNLIEYKKDDFILLEIGAGRTVKFLANEISTINSGANPIKEKEAGTFEENNKPGPEKTFPKWSFQIAQLTGIGIGGGNSKLLNLSPSIKSYYSVSPFLQIGLGIGYSNIQSNDKRIILRTGGYYVYPGGTNVTVSGININNAEFQTVSEPKATAYELINSLMNFRINFSGKNKPVQFFSELGLGFGYAPTKDLNLEMESKEFSGYVWYLDPITTMYSYEEYSFKYKNEFRSRYSNALLIELGTGIKFKSTKKQHFELKLSYQNTRGNINYTYTPPYANIIKGRILPSFIPTKTNEIKGKDFLNLSFIAFSVAYGF